jgi:hypothetical protein
LCASVAPFALVDTQPRAVAAVPALTVSELPVAAATGEPLVPDALAGSPTRIAVEHLAELSRTPTVKIRHHAIDTGSGDD